MRKVYIPGNGGMVGQYSLEVSNPHRDWGDLLTNTGPKMSANRREAEKRWAELTGHPMHNAADIGAGVGRRPSLSASH